MDVEQLKQCLAQSKCSLGHVYYYCLFWLLPLSFATSVVVHIRIVPRFSAPENVRSKPVYSHHIPFSNRKVLSLLCACGRQYSEARWLWAGETSNRQLWGSRDTMCTDKGTHWKGREASEPPQREEAREIKEGFLLEVTSELRPSHWEAEEEERECVSGAQNSAERLTSPSLEWLPPSYRWENWDSGKLSILAKTTKLVDGTARVSTQCRESTASLCYWAELHQAADGSTVWAGRLEAEQGDSLSHVKGCWFARAIITKHHRPGGPNIPKQKCILSQFWRLEAQDQGAHILVSPESFLLGLT